MSSVNKCVQVCYASAMKLGQYAKQQGISYRTALRWIRAGTIHGYRAPTGTIIVQEDEPVQAIQKVAIYARVLEASHKEDDDATR